MSPSGRALQSRLQTGPQALHRAESPGRSRPGGGRFTQVLQLVTVNYHLQHNRHFSLLLTYKYPHFQNFSL